MDETKQPTKKRKKITNNLEGAFIEPIPISETPPRTNIDTKKKLQSNIVQALEYDMLDTSELDRFTTMSRSRDLQGQSIDQMMQDASVSSVVRTFAADATQPNDLGHVVWAESDDPRVSMYVNYLLDKLNIDKLANGHAYDLVTWGDVYLHVLRESDYEDPFFSREKAEKIYGARNVLNESVLLDIKNKADSYTFTVETVPDPTTMFELESRGMCYGYIETPNSPSISNRDGYDPVSGLTAASTYCSYHVRSNDIIIHQADDYVHLMLDNDHSRYPEEVTIFKTDDENDNLSNANKYTYRVRRGKSMLIDAYKTWREKQLLESSILLNRITKSSIVRKVGVEVGNLSKDKSSQIFRGVKNMFEQKASIRVGEGYASSNYPGPVENFIYYTTHGGQGAISVESVGGDVDNIRSLVDYDSWVDRFYGHFGIPKQFFGIQSDGAGFNGGTSLSITSSSYAKLVVMIQSAMINGYTDLIDLYLLDKGLTSYVGSYTLKMKAPVTQEEKDAREAFSAQISAASSLLALFQDVENKPRRLKIVKQIIKPFNYGDEIMQLLDDEVADVEAKLEEEALEAEKEAELEAQSGNEPLEDTGSEDEDLNADLDLALESFRQQNEDNTALLEDLDDLNLDENTLDNELLNNNDFLAEASDLPTPDQLDSRVDFTENN